MALPTKSQRIHIESNSGTMSNTRTQMMNPENDILINGFSNVKQRAMGHHPLEQLERTHRQRVDNSNFAMLKSLQGIHAPLRLMAERRAAARIGRLPFLVSSNLQMDVFEGSDDTIGFEDFLNDPEQSEVMGPPHMIVEKKIGIL